ncbi:MAG TPA: dihydrofolate reductase family protein [Dongiaceae bacterium]|nr:dihydrofolate reductase family protein [Dongiaceae bacterium]
MRRPRISVYIATSLDGFIGRPDGRVDWLGPPPEHGEEDYGYGEFMSGVDLLVMGRATFAMALAFETWPYGDLRVLVLSNHAVPIPPPLRGTVAADAGDPADLVAREPIASARHVYLDGGITVQRFLAEGLVDDLTITTVPVLLGEGRPLFGPVGRDVPLEHVHTRTWSNGYVQTAWVLRPGG